MSHLAIARAVVTGDERNEGDEKSSDLSEQDTKFLKARIIKAVTVDPFDFDRAEYDRLWTLYTALAADGVHDGL